MNSFLDGIGAPPFSGSGGAWQELETDPTERLEGDLAALLEGRLGEVPPSERARFASLLEQVSKPQAGRRRTKYFFGLFDMSRPGALFEIETILNDPGVISRVQEHTHWEKGRLYYWMGLFVEEGLYRRLRERELRPPRPPGARLVASIRAAVGRLVRRLPIKTSRPADQRPAEQRAE